MAIRPGITGNPAELLDGAKVNSLTEYTVGNGVQLQGRTSGVAIEAGKVGETIAYSATGYGSRGTGNLTDNVEIGNGTQRITLAKGNYILTTCAAMALSGANSAVCSVYPSAISGSITYTSLDRGFSCQASDNTSSAYSKSSFYIAVSSDAVVCLKAANKSGTGNINPHWIDTGGAIRIA